MRVLPNVAGVIVGVVIKGIENCKNWESDVGETLSVSKMIFLMCLFEGIKTRSFVTIMCYAWKWKWKKMTTRETVSVKSCFTIIVRWRCIRFAGD